MDITKGLSTLSTAPRPAVAKTVGAKTPAELRVKLAEIETRSAKWPKNIFAGCMTWHDVWQRICRAERPLRFVGA